MTQQYEDWTDWAGDHPEQAEADLRAAAAREERYAEHRRLAAQTIPDRDGADSARLHSIERKAREAAAAAGPRCSTEGHEYNFGICLDCEQVDPAFEPDDGQIPGTYEIQKAAA